MSQSCNCQLGKRDVKTPVRVDAAQHGVRTRMDLTLLTPHTVSFAGPAPRLPCLLSRESGSKPIPEALGGANPDTPNAKRYFRDSAMDGMQASITLP
jgi:hypothetical protein